VEAKSQELETLQDPQRGRLQGLVSGRSVTAFSETLVLPSRLLLLFIIAFPASVAIYVAFTEWTPTTGAIWYRAYEFWNWFDNYAEALSSSDFWLAIWRTALVTIVAVGVEFLLGFLIAFLLVKQFRGRGILTVSFLLPMMVVPAVSGFIFFMIFQADGPINDALSLILPGDIKIGWLTDPAIALWSVIIADIWQWTPLMFLIFLAGLVSLPEDQMNAARILQAGFWHQLRLLILPMMKPVILIALIIRAIETFKLFDSAWILTRGGPGEASTTISVFLFRETFLGTRWGFSSAVAILILILVSVAALRAIRPIEQAQEESLEELLTSEGRSTAEAERELERAAQERGAQAAALEGGDAGAVRPQLRFSPPERKPIWPKLRPFVKGTAIAVIWAAFMFPLYWTVTMAFKPQPEWTPVGKVFWAPDQPTIDNFKDVLGLSQQVGILNTGQTDATDSIYRSLITATGGTAFALILGIFASYAIARFRAGGKILPFQILQLRMFPPVAIIMPLLIFWAYIHLVDTIHGLVIVYGALTFPFVVWLMRSFFQEVPREITEAAIVDGCGHWGAFFKTVLPQVRSGIAATALFVFILNWSDFLIALILTQQNVTAPVFLNSMQSVSAGQLFGPQAALAAILIVPPALFGLSIQRYLVRGLTFGAIKR
jgi:multiple sugar transport system permease protein